MANTLTAEQEKELREKLNGVLSTAKLDDVTAESAGFREVPQGHFLIEVTGAEVRLSKSGNPMAMFTLKTVEDGRSLEDIGETIPKTKGLSLIKCYVLTDESKVKSLASDGIKFELDEKHTTLPKEAFTTYDTLKEALSLLVGKQLYIQHTVDKKDDGSVSEWVNFLSWKRAEELGLPC